MKVSTEIDKNFGYEKITQLVDNIPLNPNVLADTFYPGFITFYAYCTVYIYHGLLLLIFIMLHL